MPIDLDTPEGMKWFSEHYFRMHWNPYVIAHYLKVPIEEIHAFLQKYELTGISFGRGKKPKKLEIVEDREWFVQLYCEEGKTQQEIADLIGVNRKTIHIWLQRHGIIGQKKVGKDYAYRDRGWLQTQVEKGLGYAQIGALCGACPETINQWVRRFDLDQGKEKKYKDPTWLQAKVDAGFSFKDIATEVDADVSTIRYWRKRYHIKHIQKVYPYQDKTWLLEQINQGLTISEIAKRINCSRAVIYKWINLLFDEPPVYIRKWGRK